jgi:feruloyl esterase
MALVVNSTNPDLSRFRDRGGKLIQYAGWGDTAIAPQSGLNYYRKVSSVTGDVHNFYRVFMAPGMAHCYGGPGPNSFGNGDNHEMWVEWGVAPEKSSQRNISTTIPRRASLYNGRSARTLK